ncbi:Peptidase C14 [Penicillium expansum]|nr:Peptidase C14 [Penicillium expansum]
MLVDDCSGILATIDRDPVSLDRAHTRMNKFPGAEDSDYKLVADAVTSYLETIRKGRPLEELERLLREWHYTAENLQILRLNKDFLPMDRCYINLAIVEQIGEEKNISKQNERVKPSSEFSFAARLAVETPDEDIQVEIPNIFQARTGQDPPKKVLIRGRAGVGKTTLCKKIVHDFVYGDLWKCHFDLIFWLPLRRLKMLHHVNTRSIRDVISNEYLSRVYTDEDLAHKAWGAMHTSDYRKTLFLLDGLDEVSDMLKGDIPIIRDLLNLPNVIVTSRPHASLPDSLKREIST